MDFPPLDDRRWDRLLGAVLGHPTDDSVPPPAPPSSATEPTAARAGRDEVVERTVDLDAYA